MCSEGACRAAEFRRPKEKGRPEGRPLDHATSVLSESGAWSRLLVDSCGVDLERGTYREFQVDYSIPVEIQIIRNGRRVAADG